MRERIYTPKEFSKLVKRTVKTLQRWDREGILSAYRTPTRRRYYTHTQYLDYLGVNRNELLSQEKSSRREAMDVMTEAYEELKALGVMDLVVKQSFKKLFNALLHVTEGDNHDS